jgi:hypothetical protein
MTRRHCVRCHVEYDPASPGGCRVRAGRDTDTRAVGERAVTVCLQCEHEHRVDTRPFCFQGEHTSNAALANWGVSDASDPLDFPAPEAPTCAQCGGKVWGEAAPAEARAEQVVRPGAATQSLATAFRRYTALAAQYDEASWGMLEPEEQARLVAEARGEARQRPGPTSVLHPGSPYWAAKQGAEQLFREGRLPDAEAGYRSALEMLGRAIDPLEMRAAARQTARPHTSKPGKACQELSAARSEQGKVESNLSLILLKRGLAHESVSMANEAIVHHPTWPKVHARRAEALVALGQHAAAACSYEIAAECARDAKTSQTDVEKWERAACEQEEAAAAAAGDKAGSAAGQHSDQAACAKVLTQLLDLGVLRRDQVSQLEDSVSRGDETAASLISTWSPRAQARLLQNTGAFAHLGDACAVVLHCLTPSSLAAMECTCRAFRGFDPLAREKIRRAVWTRSLPATGSLLTAPIAEALARYCEVCDASPEASDKALEQLVCGIYAEPRDAEPDTAAIAHVVGNFGRRLPPREMDIFWQHVVDCHRMTYNWDLHDHACFFKWVFLLEYPTEDYRFVEGALDALSNALGPSVESYTLYMKEQARQEGSARDWRRAGKGCRGFERIESWFRHGLVKALMKICYDGVCVYDGVDQETDRVIRERGCVLIHLLLELFGKRMSFICPAILRLQSDHLAWFYQLWCIHSPLHAPSQLPGTHHAKHLLRHFDAFPSVLRRLCRCSKSQPSQKRQQKCSASCSRRALRGPPTPRIPTMTTISITFKQGAAVSLLAVDVQLCCRTGGTEPSPPCKSGL